MGMCFVAVRKANITYCLLPCIAVRFSKTSQPAVSSATIVFNVELVLVHVFSHIMGS